MDVDLQCVASFLVLREEGHFGRAAARLHVTSPGLSKRIQKLEREVGVLLVTRASGGGIALTAAGCCFAEHASLALDQARRAQAAAREAASARVHTVVRIGVPGTTSTDSMLCRVVAPMAMRQAQLPGIALRVRSVPFDSFLQALLSGAIDLLWSPAPIRRPDVLSHEVGTSARVGIVPRGHPLAVSAQSTAKRFAELPLLRSPALPPEATFLGALGDIRPLADAHLVHTNAQGFAALRDDVARGRGVIVVPDVLATGLGPHLACVTLTGLAPGRFYVMQRRSDRRPLLGEVLRALARRD